MEKELDYRKELADARAAIKDMPLQGAPEVIDAYMEVVYGLVLLAEQDLREQDHEWEIASLARELLVLGRQLEQYDHVVSTLYTAADRMLNAVSEHPRLKAELLRFKIEVLERGCEVSGHESSLVDDLNDELEALEHNIALADAGKPEAITQTGHLKHDPIEWTARWEEIIDDADRKVFDALADTPRGMGFCHAYWHTRAEVLRRDYGLEWRSPAVMNPRVLFD
jgi:hypothetical protein